MCVLFLTACCFKVLLICLLYCDFTAICNIVWSNVLLRLCTNNCKVQTIRTKLEYWNGFDKIWALNTLNKISIITNSCTIVNEFLIVLVKPVNIRRLMFENGKVLTLKMTTSEIFQIGNVRSCYLIRVTRTTRPARRGAAGPHACKECAPLIRGATMGLIGVPRRADLHGFLTARALLARSYVSVTLCAPRRAASGSVRGLPYHDIDVYGYGLQHVHLVVAISSLSWQMWNNYNCLRCLCVLRLLLPLECGQLRGTRFVIVRVFIVLLFNRMLFTL